jgi:hypothetical protein
MKSLHCGNDKDGCTDDLDCSCTCAGCEDERFLGQENNPDDDIPEFEDGE